MIFRSANRFFVKDNYFYISIYGKPFKYQINHSENLIQSAQDSLSVFKITLDTSFVISDGLEQSIDSFTKKSQLKSVRYL